MEQPNHSWLKPRVYKPNTDIAALNKRIDKDRKSKHDRLNAYRDRQASKGRLTWKI